MNDEYVLYVNSGDKVRTYQSSGDEYNGNNVQRALARESLTFDVDGILYNFVDGLLWQLIDQFTIQ